MCEAKTHMKGQDKYGLWKSNVKRGNIYIYGVCQGLVPSTFLDMKAIALLPNWLSRAGRVSVLSQAVRQWLT